MLRIEKNKFRKIANLSILLFTLFFARNILRNVKDGLVASNIGTESISFIAICLHVPLAFLLLKLYNKFSQERKLTKTFFITLVSFLTFFILFAFVVYPNKNFFHPSEVCVENLISKFPNFKWVIKIYGSWSVALFAVFSELWVTVVCSISFWQLANKINSVADATRFYIYLSSLGQLSLVFVGPFTTFLKKFITINENSLLFQNKNEAFTQLTVIVVFLISILSLVLYSSLEREHSIQVTTKKVKKRKLKFRESLKLVVRNKYFMMLCIITFSYSAIMSWSDGIIMCIIKKQYSNLQDLCEFKSKIMSYTGALTIFFSFFGNYLLKKTSWKTTALVIPLVTLISGSTFFISSYAYIELNVSCLSLSVLLAGIYSSLSKAAKYSLFDSTKEMTYTPLDPMEKQQGQSAVDIVGDNIGKILGSGVQFVVLILFPTVLHEDLVGVLFGLFFMTSIVWIYAIFNLAKMYEEKNRAS